MKEKSSEYTGKLPPDLHVHTALSMHGEGTMEETVLSAIAKGLSEIGFSEHFYYPEGFAAPAPDCVVPDSKTFEQYVSEAERLRKRYEDRIVIRLGVEIDYLPDHMNAIQKNLSLYPFDYVIGSVHIVNGVDFDYREDRLARRLDALGGAEGLWRGYWRELSAFVSTGLFDVAGHLDLPKKFGITKSDSDFSMEIEAVLDAILKAGLAMEVNTGGIDRAAPRETYPSPSILEKAVRKGINIVFGSDAHRPGDAGRYFAPTAGHLCSLGLERVFSFDRKRRLEVFGREPGAKGALSFFSAAPVGNTRCKSS